MVGVTSVGTPRPSYSVKGLLVDGEKTYGQIFFTRQYGKSESWLEGHADAIMALARSIGPWMPGSFANDDDAAALSYRGLSPARFRFFYGEGDKIIGMQAWYLLEDMEFSYGMAASTAAPAVTRNFLNTW